MYVCGVSSGFNEAAANIDGKAGGVRGGSVAVADGVLVVSGANGVDAICVC